MNYLYFFLVGFVASTVHFEEKFGDGWDSRWVNSKHKGSEQGKFILSAGKFYNDDVADAGLKTSEDARFYGISAKFENSVSNDGVPLVVQLTVKHEQNIDCGGGYVKIFPATLDQSDMHGDSAYSIMFGPDICGPGTKRVHVIFNYKGQNLLTKKDIRCKDDVYTHVYTLIVRPDNTYEVKIDNKKVESGSLEDDWDFLPSKTIKDPEAKKPEDWDDNEKIDDIDETKPEDWDKAEHIPDPDAKKPDDWDDEMDGEWEPPMIDNPEFKGEWKPKKVDNPNYSGVWKHPEIDNPAYVADDKLYFQKDLSYVGIDVWQVKSGTIFDNLLITDDEEVASKAAEEIEKTTMTGEKAMKEKQDAEEEAERKKNEPEPEEEAEAEEEEDEDEADEVDEMEDDEEFALDKDEL